jgi:hypothetical protein
MIVSGGEASALADDFGAVSGGLTTVALALAVTVAGATAAADALPAAEGLAPLSQANASARHPSHRPARRESRQGAKGAKICAKEEIWRVR